MPRRSDSINRDRSSIGSRKVPVQVPPCQMLNTAIPVSAYQLRRRLGELPGTSKKPPPSRGSGAAADADTLPMVAPAPSVCPVRTDYGQRPLRVTQSRHSVKHRRPAGVLRHVAAMEEGGTLTLRARAPIPGEAEVLAMRRGKLGPRVRDRVPRWHHSSQA